MDLAQYFTPQMAERAQRALDADLRRRSAKLARLQPNPSPYANLMAPYLDYQEGDPERLEAYLNEPPLSHRVGMAAQKDAAAFNALSAFTPWFLP